MKKEPGVNGDWVPVSMQERVHAAAIPSIVTLGTPMLIQVQYAFSNGWGERGWLLPSVIWVAQGNSFEVLLESLLQTPRLNKVCCQDLGFLAWKKEYTYVNAQ